MTLPHLVHGDTKQLFAEAVERMDAKEAEENANDTDTVGVAEADWGGHNILRSYVI